MCSVYARQRICYGIDIEPQSLLILNWLHKCQSIYGLEQAISVLSFYVKKKDFIIMYFNGSGQR